MSIEDLDGLFTPPQLPGPSSDIRFRQGILLEFDSLTLANRVLVGRTELENLPMLGVAESASLRVGTSLGLMAIKGTDGTTTYVILGQLVRPETPAATQAVTALNDRIASVADNGGTIGSTSGDTALYEDFGGPDVSIHVGPSGSVLLILGCGFNYGTDDDIAGGSAGGAMTVAISGATTRAASSDYEVRMQANHSVPPGADITTTFDQRVCMVSTVTGLTPGWNTFSGRYRSTTTGISCSITDPIVAVIAL